jgi:hypothetical protein
MAMSKKDYVMIASIINHEIGVAKMVPPGEAREARIGVCNVIAGRIAERCKHDNPRFDRNRFLVACGVREVA